MGKGDSAFIATPTISIDGKVRDRVAELLVEMTVVERDDGLSTLELRLTDFATDRSGAGVTVFIREESIKLGADITVQAGETGAQRTIFEGTITALESAHTKADAPQLVILAEDALQQARMTRRTTVYEKLTISDISTRIAVNMGLQVDTIDIGDDPTTQVQLNESDLGFLRRILERNDCVLGVSGKLLKISKRGDRQENTVQLRMHQELQRARVLADLAHQVSSVTVSGWDETQGKRVSASSQGTSFGPGAGRKGADFLVRTIGDRAEHFGHLAAATDTEAKAIADAAYNERARRFVTAEATTAGDSRIRVGVHVEMSGLGDLFDNTYMVTSATHQYDLTNGYRTSFEAECAFLGDE